jgi:hypothetical protein
MLAGLAVGGALVYGATWQLTESLRGAILYTTMALGFFLLPAAAFMAAAVATARGVRPSSTDDPAASARRAAVGLPLCSIPFVFGWFAIVQGRLALGLCLFAVYLAAVFLPLRSLYRARLAANLR